MSRLIYILRWNLLLYWVELRAGSWPSACEPRHDKTNKNECAPSEDSDQPGHPPSLIRVFAVRMKKTWVLSYPLSGCPGWSESSLGAHSLSWFCHAVAQKILHKVFRYCRIFGSALEECFLCLYIFSVAWQSRRRNTDETDHVLVWERCQKTGSTYRLPAAGYVFIVSCFRPKYFYFVKIFYMGMIWKQYGLTGKFHAQTGKFPFKYSYNMKAITKE